MVPLQSAVDVLAQNPELAIILGLVLRGVRAWQTELSWYEYRTLHGLRRWLFPLIDDQIISTINEKGGRGDGEYLRTVDSSVRDTARQLRDAGGSLHLISSVKRRPETHGDPLSRAHVMWTHADGRQTEAYLFGNGSGTTDVYVHEETSVDDPVGHLTDTQQDGDTRGIVSRALE